MTRSPQQETRTDPGYREVQSGFWKLALVTEVRDDGVYVRFRPLQRSFTRYGFDEIASVATTTYSAGEYGGWHWGIHLGPTGSTSYRISGDRGVRLDLTDDDSVFVGSEEPDAFVDAVRRAMEEER